MYSIPTTQSKTLNISIITERAFISFSNKSFHTCPQRKLLSDFYHHNLVFPVFDLHLNRTITFFSVSDLSTYLFWDFMSLHITVFYLFLLHNSILLNKYSTLHLYLLLGIWVVPSLELLLEMKLWIFLYMSFCGHVFISRG